IIKAGKVRTQGTPQQIIHDPVAIDEYLGNSFTEDPLGRLTRPSPPAPALATTAVAAPTVSIHEVVEQEKLHRLVDRLRTDDHGSAAAELLQRGPAAVAPLLEALDRRDVDMRRRASELLRALLPGVDFDPAAPETQRRQQIERLR